MIQQRVGMRLSVAMLISVLAAAVDLPRPVFRVSFEDTLAPVQAAGETVHPSLTSEGTTYVDGYRGKGVLLGARAPLVYQAGGNVPAEATVSLWVKPLDWESIDAWRYLIALIPRGRGIMFLAHYPRRDPVLQFLWTPTYSPDHQATDAPLRMNQWNHVAVAWDAVRSRVYFNGNLVLSRPHPSGFHPRIPDQATLQLGGMRAGVSSGGSYASEPWGIADTVIDELVVYPGALSAVQVAALAGRTLQTRPRRGPSPEPPLLALPMLRSTPIIDGRLGDGEWRHALKLPPLIDANRPGTSFDFPPQDIFLAYDNDHLYLALQVEFPPGAQIPRGGTRDGLEAPDEPVWDDESFEIWLLRPGEERPYRFAGNVAGGFTEMLGTDMAWNGVWTYRGSVSTSIRSNLVWQAEAAIPWATLEMRPEASTRFTMNICRTWRSLDRLGVTSLGGAPTYLDPPSFAEIHLDPGAPAAHFHAGGSPSSGEALHTWILSNLTGKPLEATVTATLVSDLPDNDRTVLNATVSLPAAEHRQVQARITVDDSMFQRLRYDMVSADGSPWLRYSVPFELRADFLDVIPILSEDVVVVRPATTLYRRRLASQDMTPERIVLRLVDPGARTVAEETVTADDDVRMRLPADGPTGEFRVQLIGMGPDGPLDAAERRFERPPRPPWLSPRDDVLDRVLPPFEALTTQIGQDGTVSVRCWDRRVLFGDALLPLSVESGAAGNLLAGPATLYLGAEPIEAATVTLTAQSDVRSELLMVAADERATCTNETWIEYDGVMVHRVSIEARRPIEDVTLRVPLQARFARFGHFASGGFGAGGGFTRELAEGMSTGFYPVVWLGNFERGLAWFCEGGQDIGYAGANPVTITPTAESTELRIRLWRAIAAGETVTMRFGFVATPVKPLHPRYPLNVFARDALWDHPPAVPLYASVVWNPRNFFQDLPYYDPARKGRVTAGALLRERDRRTATKLMPYMTPYTLSTEYPAARQFRREWEIVPVRHDDSPTRQVGENETLPWTELWLSPASESYRRYYAWKFAGTLAETGIEAVYFDFGCAFPDSNVYHGAHGGFPLLGMRDFYRRIANELVKSGVEDYAIVSHNSQAIQIPAMTFVTHFYNGEHLRTSSSPALHDGRDYLDTLPLYYFGIEHSGLPWGIHGNMLVEFDESEHLVQRLGVTDETVTEYLWNRTPSVVMPILLHGCLPDGYRLSLPYYKSVVAALHAFDVPSATFHPYWRNAERIQVDNAHVRVSAYARPEGPRVLLVVGNLHKEPVETTLQLDLTQFYDWNDSPLSGMKRVARQGELLQVRELVGARDARILGIGPHQVTLWIRGHAMALVEVTGHIRIR